MTSVPRIWADATVVILAGGPSLTQADVDICRDRARVIAIKDTIRLAPWAGCLYACDAKWWRHYGDGLAFDGPKYALEQGSNKWAGVLHDTGPLGLELKPTGLRTGRNSGYQAINLAVHLGAKRIVLLGYDMRPTGERHHWFGVHPYNTSTPPYDHFLPCFDSIVEPLRALGIDVFNATRKTALAVFPQLSLEEALA